MNKNVQLKKAKELGYSMGPSASLKSIESEFCDWCKFNDLPFIEIITKIKYCIVRADATSPEMKLNARGRSLLKSLFLMHPNGVSSIDKEGCFHDKIPAKDVEQIANAILFFFADSRNRVCLTAVDP